MTTRRTLRRLRAMIATGDRSGALKVIDVEIERGLTPMDPRQLLFAVMRFECPRLHVTMPVRDCLERRGSVWASGGRKGSPKRLECQGCELGEAFAFACPGIRLRPPTDPPEVMPASQRLAKRARTLVDPGMRVDMDPIREAAMATPDDKGEWR